MGHTLTGMLALGAVLVVLVVRWLERSAPRRGCTRRRCPSTSGDGLTRSGHGDSATHHASTDRVLAYRGSSDGSGGSA